MLTSLEQTKFQWRLVCPARDVEAKKSCLIASQFYAWHHVPGSETETVRCCSGATHGALRALRLWADSVSDLASRPEESHLRPLIERCVNLSIDTAPIKQSHRPFSMVNAFVALKRFFLLPVERSMQPLDPPLSLQPHYQPSSLVRIGPPQCCASVLSRRGFRHLCFSLDVATTGSRSSTQKPGSADPVFIFHAACTQSVSP